MITLEAAGDLQNAFQQHRAFLWAVCYRLTGSAADAEEVVQETFVRALERPPSDLTMGWRPWLTKVALNLGRDLLRRRRRQPYVGAWLPTPIDTQELDEIHGTHAADEALDPLERYSQIESVTMAFLLALEVLTPSQRAVVLLRDVFDYSAEESAVALSMSTANVRTTHHRARRALASYDQLRLPPSADVRTRTARALTEFLGALASRDVQRLEALLADDVRTLTDAGGEFTAALNAVKGRANVLRLFLARQQKMGPPATQSIVDLNGLPALVAGWRWNARQQPPMVMLQCELDHRTGRIQRIYTVLATCKLGALRRPPYQPHTPNRYV